MEPLSSLHLLAEAVRNAGADIAPTYQEYIQLAFAIANINHIHNYAMEETRATISSVNNMLQQTLSGISLICFKFVIEPGSGTAGLSFASAFSVFGAFYLSLFVLLLYIIFKRSAEHDAEHTPGTAC